MDGPKEQLKAALADSLMRPHLALLEQYARERELMGSVGAILDPTLYRSSERRTVDAAIAPLFEQVRAFCRAVAEARSVLAPHIGVDG